jgi:hypothetical protein
MVHVDFNMIVPGMRSDEHPSFPFSLSSLADVPIPGDFCGMPRWNHTENREYHQLVKVIARRVHVDLTEGDVGRELRNLYVTLLVEKANDPPDFRG